MSSSSSSSSSSSEYIVRQTLPSRRNKYAMNWWHCSAMTTFMTRVNRSSTSSIKSCVMLHQSSVDIFWLESVHSSILLHLTPAIQFVFLSVCSSIWSIVHLFCGRNLEFINLLHNLNLVSMYYSETNTFNSQLSQLSIHPRVSSIHTVEPWENINLRDWSMINRITCLNPF